MATKIIGNRTRVKVVKNKVAPPFKQAEFDLMYGEGISFEGDLVDLGVAHNIVVKSGSWYSYGSDRIGQGRENAKQFLKDNPEVRDKVEVELRQALELPAQEAPSEANRPKEPSAAALSPAPKNSGSRSAARA